MSPFCGSWRPEWRVIAFGQLLSLLLTVQSVCTQALAERGVKIAAVQSWGNYLLLSFLFLKRKKFDGQSGSFLPRLRVRWHNYAILALLDVEGNFLIVKGYDEGATITSAMLLDCFVIPQVMLLSYFFLRHRYRAAHCAGVSMCLAGLVVLVFADYYRSRASDTSGSTSPASTVVGDLLVLSSTVCYAASNVGQETMVKHFDKWEYLGMLGIFGTVITTVQLIVFEKALAFTHLADVQWSADAVGLLVCFVCSLFAFYVLTAIFLERADATVFNLSLLTSDVFGVVAGVFLFHERLNYIYAIAFSLTMIGVSVYNSRRVPVGGGGEASAAMLADHEQVATKDAGEAGELRSAGGSLLSYRSMDGGGGEACSV